MKHFVHIIFFCKSIFVTFSSIFNRIMYVVLTYFEFFVCKFYSQKLIDVFKKSTYETIWYFYSERVLINRVWIYRNWTNSNAVMWNFKFRNQIIDYFDIENVYQIVYSCFSIDHKFQNMLRFYFIFFNQFFDEIFWHIMFVQTVLRNADF